MSTCCEYRHKFKTPRGRKCGSFAISNVLKAKPCRKFVNFILIRLFQNCAFFLIDAYLDNVKKRHYQLIHFQMNHLVIRSLSFLDLHQDVNLILQLFEKLQVRLIWYLQPRVFLRISHEHHHYHMKVLKNHQIVLFFENNIYFFKYVRRQQRNINKFNS